MILWIPLVIGLVFLVLTFIAGVIDKVDDEVRSGCVVVALIAGVVLILTGMISLENAVNSPVRVLQIEAMYQTYTEAVSQPDSNLSTAAVLKIADFNATIVNHRRWERSIVIGQWYADLPSYIQRISIK